MTQFFMHGTLKPRQWITILILLALVLAACAGVILTRESAQPDGSGAASSQSLVDQQPLLTARKLASLADTLEQQRLAQETLRLADHAVDIAFADALRNATQHPVPASPQTKELADRLDQSRERLKADQDHADQLKKKMAGASDRDRDAIQEQLDLMQAQLELDQDEVEDAQ